MPGCGGEALPYQGGSRHVSGQSLQPPFEEEATVIIRELTHVGGHAPASDVELGESQPAGLGVTGSCDCTAHRPQRQVTSDLEPAQVPAGVIGHEHSGGGQAVPAVVLGPAVVGQVELKLHLLEAAAVASLAGGDQDEGSGAGAHDGGAHLVRGPIGQGEEP